MIVHNFHIMRLAILPREANSPPIIDPNAVLPDPAPFERFEMIARRYSKVLQASGGIKVKELAARHALDGPKPENGLVVKEKLRIPAPKRSDQASVYDAIGITSNGIYGKVQGRVRPHSH
jgi:hypothetical protein